VVVIALLSSGSDRVFLLSPTPLYFPPNIL
jgi:hypothetical protein